MTGARLVHDTLEAEAGVEIADAQKVKGLAPLACKTDKIDSLVLATLSQRDLVPAIWLPTPGARGARAGALSPALGQAPLDAQAPHPLDPDQLRAALPGHRPVRGRGTPAARAPAGARALALKRQRLGRADRRPRGPDRQINQAPAGRPRRPPLHPAAYERPRGRLGARVYDRRRDRRDRALLRARRSSTGYTGLCPRVSSRASRTVAGRSTKHGPRYLRWALLEATMHALQATPPTQSATRARRGGSASSAARRSRRSTSPAGSPTRSGTCLRATENFAPRGAAFVWRPDRPFGIASASEGSDFA